MAIPSDLSSLTNAEVMLYYDEGVRAVTFTTDPIRREALSKDWRPDEMRIEILRRMNQNKTAASQPK